ncbi:MAG: hypothetical protein WCJ84_00625 [Candidatus Peregrinibacteria bacterium]
MKKSLLLAGLLSIVLLSGCTRDGDDVAAPTATPKVAVMPTSIPGFIDAAVMPTVPSMPPVAMPTTMVNDGLMMPPAAVMPGSVKVENGNVMMNGPEGMVKVEDGNVEMKGPNGNIKVQDGNVEMNAKPTVTPVKR